MVRSRRRSQFRRPGLAAVGYRLKRLGGLMMQTLAQAWEDRISRMAASLAFYATFSIGPMLLIMVKIASAFVGEKAADAAIRTGLAAWLGREPAAAIEAMLHEAALLQSGGGIVTILGVIALIWAIISLFMELHDSMDTIWGVQLKTTHGWRTAIQHRLLSFIVMLGTGIAVTTSLIISAALASGAGGSETLPRAIGSASSFVIFTLLFAALYKWLPDVRVPWRDVLLGAAVTSGLLVLGEYLVSLYLAAPRTISVYGAIGSLAILLLWVYYSAHALFLGLEFTQVYSRRAGDNVQPEPDARWMSKEERAKHAVAPASRSTAAKERPTRKDDGNGSI